MDYEIKLIDALDKLAETNTSRVLDMNKFRDINRIPDTGFIKEVYRFPDTGAYPHGITIVPLGDMHLGSKQCNIPKLQATIDLILETENCYTILLGDHTETATKTSVGMSVYEEEFPLEDQITMIVKMLKPLADAGKILGALIGNHEMRVAYATSINVVKLVARELGINFFGFQAYLSIHVGNQIYHVFAHHGNGGGSTPAGKLNAMRKFKNIADADLYLSGHTHGRMADYDVVMTIDDNEDRVVPVMKHYAVCGSFLEYWNGYAEMTALTPTLTGIIAVTLNPNEKEVKVIL